jgi:hypothetical protein
MQRALFMIVVTSIIGCARSARPHGGVVNRSDTVAESVQTAESTIWRSVQSRDSVTFAKQLAPDYLMLSGVGHADRPREAELRLHFASGLQVDSFRLFHWRHHWITDSVLVLNYYSHAWGRYEGKPLAQLAGATAVWRRNPAGWQSVVHTEYDLPSELWDTTAVKK